MLMVLWFILIKSSTFLGEHGMNEGYRVLGVLKCEVYEMLGVPKCEEYKLGVGSTEHTPSN